MVMLGFADAFRKSEVVALDVEDLELCDEGGSGLGSRAYYDVIKQGIACIGLDASKFDTHSMRSGSISTAARNGASVWKMKEISRQESTDVLAGYIR